MLFVGAMLLRSAISGQRCWMHGPDSPSPHRAKRYGPFLLQQLAVCLVIADPLRHVLFDVGLWAGCSNNPTYARINSTDAFPSGCYDSSYQYRCTVPCCVPTWKATSNATTEYAWSPPQSQLPQLATLRPDGIIYLPSGYAAAQQPWEVFKPGALLWESGLAHAGAGGGLSDADCEHGANSATGYCFLVDEATPMPYADRLKLLPLKDAAKPFDAETSAPRPAPPPRPLALPSPPPRTPRPQAPHLLSAALAHPPPQPFTPPVPSPPGRPARVQLQPVLSERDHEPPRAPRHPLHPRLHLHGLPAARDGRRLARLARQDTWPFSAPVTPPPSLGRPRPAGGARRAWPAAPEARCSGRQRPAAASPPHLAAPRRACWWLVCRPLSFPPPCFSPQERQHRAEAARHARQVAGTARPCIAGQRGYRGGLSRCGGGGEVGVGRERAELARCGAHAAAAVRQMKPRRQTLLWAPARWSKRWTEAAANEISAHNGTPSKQAFSLSIL